MPAAAVALKWPPKMADAACEALTACVDHQHLWAAASYDLFAATCLYVVSIRAKKNTLGDLAYLAPYLGVDVHEIRALVPEVTELLVNLKARAAIAAFLPKFGKMFPAHASKAKDFAAMILRLYTMVQNEAIFPFDIVQAHWLRTVASCIFAVLIHNNLLIHSEEVCEAVGTYHSGDLGQNMDVDIGLLTIDEKD
ncbi:hypothetical protein EK21DRAFT_82615 [Setomelanomma holmii]|uniref:Uncharacterized protein n=1 Tax=Setomelanomma holmii TaxID=210430 RepID=A0A9P4GVD9_9PLEO|nr:hypothetical protein EK21DRAFT_82615 [Setomelanomma holmii]